MRHYIKIKKTHENSDSFFLHGNHKAFDSYVQECLSKGMDEYEIAQNYIPTEFFGEFDPLTIRLFNVMVRYSRHFRTILSGSYAFSIEDLREYKECLNWFGVCCNKFLDWSEELLIEFFQDKCHLYSTIGNTLLEAKYKSDMNFILKAEKMGFIQPYQYIEYDCKEREEKIPVCLNPPKELEEIISLIEQANWDKVDRRRIGKELMQLFACDNQLGNGFDYTFNTPEKRMILDGAVQMFLIEQSHELLRSELREEISNSIKRLEGHISVFNNNQQTGQIEIKAYPDGNNEIAFYIRGWGIKIDWGDGNIEEKINPLDRRITEGQFRHKFTNQDLHTIKVNTIKMDMFKCDDGTGTFCELRFNNCTELEDIWVGSYDYTGQLTVLEINQVKSLTLLSCNGNKLTNLDVSKCPKLGALDCRGNQLTSLDVSKNTTLTHLSCCGNQLASLDISKCSELISFECNHNKLVLLDVSKCPKLFRIECNFNQLTFLDIINCPEIIHLECNNNQLSASVLNSILYNLPLHERRQDEEEGSFDWYITMEWNSGYDTCEKNIIEKKGWRENKKNLVKYYYDKAKNKIKNKDYEGALAEYDKAIAIESSDVALSYVYKAGVYYKMSNNKAVLECLNKALSIDANSAHAYINRALYHRHNRNFEAAQKDYERVLELVPNVFQIVLFNEEDIYVYGELAEVGTPDEQSFAYETDLGTLFFNIYLRPAMGEGISHDTNLETVIEDIPYFADYCREHPEAIYDEKLMMEVYEQAKNDYLYRVNELKESPKTL